MHVYYVWQVAGLHTLQGTDDNMDPDVHPEPKFNTNSPVWSWNEWDPLEEVVVGIIDGATIPELTPEVKVGNRMGVAKVYSVGHGHISLSNS